MKVEINQSTHLLLSSFALSCEGEEVAALLLGKLVEGKVLISRACLLPRKQRKKDRVEVGDEDLSNAMQLAETLGLVVVGWFHSHPHITILPSHVDLKTQLHLQMLDKSFIGLIYGSFHENQNGSQRLQVIAFQAQESPDGIKQIDVPLDVELSFQKLAAPSIKQFGLDHNNGPKLPKAGICNLQDFLSDSKGVKDVNQITDEKQFIRGLIKESHLIDIANTFLQEELIIGEPKSGLEAIMAAARIAKIQASLVNPLTLL